MFNHCGQNIKPSDVWFLADTKECNNRILYIGYCPRCLKECSLLLETNKIQNKTFGKPKYGKQAKKEIELCRCDKLFTAHDLKIKKGKPYSWVYGENKEIRNKNGEVIKIKQSACDYYGQKEIIKTIDLV